MADTADAPATGPGRAWLGSSALGLVGLLLLAFNLRPAAAAIGPLLATLIESLQMSGQVAGLLTTLPVLCFAGFGALAPGVAARIGVHRAIFGGLLLMVAGQLLRATTGSLLVFLIASALSLAGMATANVLLPSLVKRHFPDRPGLITALYSTCMTIGLTCASMLTVPIAHALGGWRWGLGVWALTAAVALLPWLVLIGHDRHTHATAASRAALPRRMSLGAVARTRLGWVMAIFFGIQSMHAYAVFGWLATMYRDAGFSESASGLYLGVVTGASIPLAFLLPAYAARKRRPVALMVVIALCLGGGYLGLLLAPDRLPVLWAVLLAVGTSAFPVILALISLRARTSTGTAALSGFTQSVGYLLAAPGPFLVGLLHEASDGWVVPKLFLIGLTVPFLIVAIFATRPRMLEDELPATS